MARIIRQWARVRCEEWTHEFAYRTQPGAGFSFPCDADGTLHEMHPAAQANWTKCLDGTHDVVDKGIKHYEWWYTEPAVLRCDCGREVDLDGFTNTCDCGADYNMSGSRLAPRSQWGEETGETADDILMYGAGGIEDYWGEESLPMPPGWEAEGW